MNILKIEQFVKVCESESLSKAAEELYISQPALSRSIAYFENCVGLKLFDRDCKRISMNASGKIAYRYCREILDQYKKMKLELEKVQQNSIRILHDDVTLFSLLKGYFLSSNPQYQLHSVPLEPYQSPADIFRSDSTDLMVWYEKYEDENIQSISLPPLSIYVMVPPDSPFYGREYVYLEELDGIDFYANKETLSPGANHSEFRVSGILLELLKRSRINIKKTYVEDRILRFLGKEAKMSLFLSNQGFLINPVYQNLWKEDRKRFLLLYSSEQELFNRYLLYPRTHSTAVAAFLDWYTLPGNKYICNCLRFT